MAKETGYYVLLHEDHPSVMEILDDTQYARMKTVEPEYIIIAHTATKSAALDVIMDKLRLVYVKDPTMQTAKQIIKASVQ